MAAPKDLSPSTKHNEGPKKDSLLLAADVGATKTDLGLFVLKPEKSRPQLLFRECRASGDAARLYAQVAAFLAGCRVAAQELAVAVFGVAGPVDKGFVKATNLGLELETARLERELEGTPVVLLNDLYVTARALLVDAEELECVTLQEGCPDPEGVIGVMAPGTGLGQALIVPGSPFRIMPSEGGHCDFAPRSDLEVDLWRYLAERYGRVSRERVLSGPGLAVICNWFKRQVGEKPLDGPAGVLTAAAAGDETAIEIADAGALALATSAGAVARRLRLDATPSFPLTWTGGLLTFSAFYRALTLRAIAERVPAARPQPPKHDAAVGAGLLAWAHLHAQR
jgi:glucokinase